MLIRCKLLLLQALMNLSKIRTLTSVSLADCSAITNNAMQVLAALTNLRHLAFIRCRRISEKGLEFVKALPLLQSLAVFGCSKVNFRPPADDISPKSNIVCLGSFLCIRLAALDALY